MEETDKMEMIDIRVYPDRTDIFQGKAWTMKTDQTKEPAKRDPDLASVVRFLTPSSHRRVYIDYR